MNFSRRPTLRALTFALITAAALLLAACAGGDAEPSAADARLRIVATTGQIGDLATNIGGEFVFVESLMGPGVDPHLYVASESDVERLANADIIFYNGLFLEAQMADVFEQIGRSRPVTAVGEAIDHALLLPWGHASGGTYDPHIWFDVTLWSRAAEAVRDTLIEVDPTHAAAYRASAETYLAQLAELDAYVREQAQRLPLDQRVLVTAHDAFSYFGKAYGFEVRGLQGISTASEAGASDVRDLATFIAERQVHALFVESSVPVRNIEALKAAVEAQGWQVTIGGSLFSDAMGSPDTPEGTYIGMVRHNINTIVAALLGESAP